MGQGNWMKALFGLPWGSITAGSYLSWWEGGTDACLEGEELGGRGGSGTPLPGGGQSHRGKTLTKIAVIPQFSTLWSSMVLGLPLWPLTLP